MTQVSIIRCPDYEKNNVFSAVKKAVDLIGGIDKFVKSGQKVLLKPNLLRAAHPEEAVTTHPEVIRAVIRLVKGKSTDIYVGDSPAGLIKAEEVYEKCGITQVCQEEGVGLVKFDQITKQDKIPFAKIKDEMDVCISLPKFKTHNLTIITAAIKNVFGFVPGLYKTYCHKSTPNFKAFSQLLVKIYSQAQPKLHIIDSIQAMEGDGPSSGKPRQMGLVVASADGVAVDAVLTKIIGLTPLFITTTKEAHRLGLGQADLKRIDIVGERLEDVLVKNFKLPNLMFFSRIPNFISRILFKVIPLMMGIDLRLCNACLMCKNICPQEAIQEREGRLKIDFRRCILCLCCGEVCPNNALYIRFLNRRMKS